MFGWMSQSGFDRARLELAAAAVGNAGWGRICDMHTVEISVETLAARGLGLAARGLGGAARGLGGAARGCGFAAGTNGPRKFLVARLMQTEQMLVGWADGEELFGNHIHMF